MEIVDWCHGPVDTPTALVMPPKTRTGCIRIHEKRQRILSHHHIFCIHLLLSTSISDIIASTPAKPVNYFISCCLHKKKPVKPNFLKLKILFHHVCCCRKEKAQFDSVHRPGRGQLRLYRQFYPPHRYVPVLYSLQTDTYCRNK